MHSHYAFNKMAIFLSKQKNTFAKVGTKSVRCTTNLNTFTFTLSSDFCFPTGLLQFDPGKTYWYYSFGNVSDKPQHLLKIKRTSGNLHFILVLKLCNLFPDSMLSISLLFFQLIYTPLQLVNMPLYEKALTKVK